MTWSFNRHQGVPHATKTNYTPHTGQRTKSMDTPVMMRMTRKMWKMNNKLSFEWWWWWWRGILNVERKWIEMKGIECCPKTSTRHECWPTTDWLNEWWEMNLHTQFISLDAFALSSWLRSFFSLLGVCEACFGHFSFHLDTTLTPLLYSVTVLCSGQHSIVWSIQDLITIYLGSRFELDWSVDTRFANWG